MWLQIPLFLCSMLSVYLYKVIQKRGKTFTDSSQCQLGCKPITPCFASSALGYLATSELTLGLKLYLVFLCVASSVLENLSAKCTLCSFNSNTPEFMFEYTSPCKLGSVYSNKNSGALDTKSMKFFPFSGELHL